MFVFVMNESGNSVQIRPVKTGVQDDSYIHILEGIKEGEEVVTGPYELLSKQLNPGDKVKKSSGMMPQE